MENPKASLLERLRDSANVLVTVSANPSVDQLAGAIGIALLLNKMGKHASAVFSGNIPSTLEFLSPEDTLEKNTDSLRDFIIALDKSKADKLRYKVEDTHVKIFITPYHTSISQDDLEFSQGDFNVDVVLALGVHEQRELDQAITAHGRILHDATVVSVNTNDAGSLGNINWVNPKASSLCEMLVDIGEALKKEAFDAQIATAFLTGIVAETKRFSNDKTTSEAMNASSRLMAAGANQQLVASKLQESQAPSKGKDEKSPNAKDITSDDGSLSIGHGGEEQPVEEVKIDADGNLRASSEDEEAKAADKKIEKGVPDTPKFVTEPPTFGSALTASEKPEGYDPSVDPLSVLPQVEGPLLKEETYVEPKNDAPEKPEQPKPEDKQAPKPIPEPPKFNLEPSPEDVDTPESAEEQTLEEIEQSVDSPHKQTEQPGNKAEETTPELDAARQAVEQAAANSSGPLPPADKDIGATGALNVGHEATPGNLPQTPPTKPAYFDPNKIDETTGLQFPEANQGPGVENPTAPPEVPPPFMPPDLSSPNMPTHGQQPLPNTEDDNKTNEPLAPL
jgi:hypothetical protein